MAPPMQQTPKDKLLEQSSQHSVEMSEFPKINFSETESDYSNDHNPHNSKFKYPKGLPEFFTLGGNIPLNISLFQMRKEKLSKIKEQNPIIECENLSKYLLNYLGKQYILQGDEASQGQETVRALNDITLMGSDREGGIKRGEFVIIRGPSGGGKTTFLNLLGTIDQSTHGKIWIDGDQITREPLDGIQSGSKNKSMDDAFLSKLRRDKIGIVFQTFNLLALMTAYENVELPMRIKGEATQKYMKDRTKMLLKRVGLMERSEHLPSELSGGEQQRVAISRSLSNSPSIILLDEPTGDLDSKSTVEVMNLLLEINNFGYEQQKYGYGGGSHNNLVYEPITIVMVTHNEDLECYGDRVIFFEDGKIKKQVFNDYQFALNPQEYAQFLNTKV